MSKHNNNLGPSSAGKCECGRRPTLGEDKAANGYLPNYECPDCLYHRVNKRWLEKQHKEEQARNSC